MFDCIIIGGGPAGMTAALYLRRAGKSVCVLEKESFGGQIAKSPRLENYPTIPSIGGMAWSDSLFSQITEMGADFDMADVNGIEKKGDVFVISTPFGTQEAKSVILATGCHPKQLGLPRENELTGKGISYCAVCDGSFFKEKEVLVIGDANTALQYVISLAQICSKVTLVTLFDRYFADKVLVDRLDAIPNLTVYHNMASVEFKGEDELKSVLFENTKTKERVDIPCDGCFIAIGQLPSNEPFANLVDLENGFIVTDENMATKTPGLFAAGDCRKKKIRQVVTATNDGAIAALMAEQYLNSL